VADDRELEDAFAVRHEVFVEEQDVDEELEYDEYDDAAVHFVAYDGDEPVGVARLRTLEDDRVAKVERVAVLEPRRGEGIGRELMAAVEREAGRLGVAELTMHAQTHAEGFYADLGYERRGSTFAEAGIPHVEMRKRLD
ncbi:MAG: GNAT family N-acetyltransferase, partial [Halobacteriota archaeon]